MAAHRTDPVVVRPVETLPPPPLVSAEPPAELFEGLAPIECQAVVAYVEAGSYAEALKVLDRWQESRGRSKDDVSRLASTLFSRPRVRAAISRLQAFWAEQTSIHAGRILDALEAQAFADPALVYQQDGASWELKPLSEWPLHLRQAVHKIHYTETTSGYGRLKRVTKRVNVDFANRQSALEMLGRHLRLFDATKEQTVPFTLVVNTAPPPTEEPKQIGPQVIDGIGLQIRLPEE
jgi:Terminase small subunit